MFIRVGASAIVESEVFVCVVPTEASSSHYGRFSTNMKLEK